MRGISKIKNEAEEITVAGTMNDCVNEALSMYKQDDSFFGQVKDKAFLRLCPKKKEG